MDRDKMTADEWRLYISQKHSGKYKQGNANELTRSIIQWMNWNGFVVWRNNTMGVFDGTLAAEKLIDFVKYFLSVRKTPNKKSVRGVLQKCYRKSHERKGVPDIIGFQKKTGRFVSIEVKYGKDVLSTEQRAFIEQARKNGAIALTVKTMDDFLTGIKEYIS